MNKAVDFSGYADSITAGKLWVNHRTGERMRIKRFVEGIVWAYSETDGVDNIFQYEAFLRDYKEAGNE